MSRVVPGLLALVTLVAAAACSDSGQSAEDAADKLATALSELDLSSVRTTQDGAAAKLQDLVEPLAEMPVEVAVETVETEDDRARVTLAWRWDLDGREWSYSSTAELLDRGETWALAWQPSVVEPSLEPGEQIHRLRGRGPYVDYLRELPLGAGRRGGGAGAHPGGPGVS